MDNDELNYELYVKIEHRLRVQSFWQTEEQDADSQDTSFSFRKDLFI